jgi:hypothetical protein
VYVRTVSCLTGDAENVACLHRDTIVTRHQSALQLADDVARYGSPDERRLLRTVLSANATQHVVKAECVSEVWVSSRRFAFLDVSAASHEWVGVKCLRMVFEVCGCRDQRYTSCWHAWPCSDHCARRLRHQV